MNLFTVQIAGTGEELCVAARTTDHAAEVLVTFWCARCGHAPGEFHIGPGAPSAYQNDFTVQNVAAGHVVGVIVRQPDGSMLFDPAVG